MEEKLQKGLSEFIALCDLKKINKHFKEDAILRILDWIGCAISGAKYPQVEISKKYLESQYQNGECTVLGTPKKLPPRAAVFLNGIAGHVCELDDGHRTAIGHPGSITVPVALGMAEKYGCSGKDVLKAVILGYDMYTRLGRVVNPSHYRTWHTTGTCGTLASTATAASLLKLSSEEVNNALGIAATMAGGLVESFGTQAKAINIAEACQNGVDAAELAKLGLTGSHSALLGKKGFVAATCFDSPKLENLENPSENTLVSDTAFFKVYSSCGHTNSQLDLVFKFLKAINPNPEDIEDIQIKTYKISVDLTSQLKVETEDEAKFSLPFCSAIAIIHKAVSLKYFSDEIRNDPKVLALAKKVTVSEDPEATDRFPKRQAELIVRMKDGKVYEYKTLDATDEASTEQVVEKFKNAASVLSEEDQEKIINFVLHIEEQKDLSDLVAILRKI